MDCLLSFQWEPLKPLSDSFQPPCACSQIPRLFPVKISGSHLQNWGRKSDPYQAKPILFYWNEHQDSEKTIKMSIRDHNGGLASNLSMGAPEIFAWILQPSLCMLSDTEAVLTKDLRSISARLGQSSHWSPKEPNFFSKMSIRDEKHYWNEHQGWSMMECLHSLDWEPLKPLPECSHPPCACSQILWLCPQKFLWSYLQK